MSRFVDTSVLYAALDADDDHHAGAASALGATLGDDSAVTTSYVVVETAALVQRRLGPDAVRGLLRDLVPALDVVFVERDLHDAAVEEMEGSGRRSVSLVDRVSFELMRRRGITTALTLDRHFAVAGFTVVPG